jgi:hypothetical protein
MSLKVDQEQHTQEEHMRTSITAHQPRAMHRADLLLRQQQHRPAADWQFTLMSRQEFEASDDLTAGGFYEIVYDDEQGGLWWRKPASPAKQSPSNRYARPTTRFADLMNGIAHVAKGLQRFDEATDGDLGEEAFKFFR